MAKMTGAKEYSAALQAIRDEALQDCIKVNREMANEARQQSDSNIPVKTGALRDSAKVTQTKTGANINYGGKNAPYATFVHNFPQLHHDTGGPFFLYNAMGRIAAPTNQAWADAYKARIAARKVAE